MKKFNEFTFKNSNEKLLKEEYTYKLEESLDSKNVLADMLVKFNEFVNEAKANISIDVDDSDEDEIRVDVNYQTKHEGNLVEIEGELTVYDTGRSGEYEFEPGQFVDRESEEYWEQNWENIEKEILAYFNKKY